MGHVNFIEHKGKRILHIDFSGGLPAQTLALITEAKGIIAQQPEGSLLTLTDLSDALGDGEVVEAMKAYSAHNRPYVRAAAILGATGVRKLMVNAIRVLTQREWATFEDAEQAKDWLVARG